MTYAELKQYAEKGKLYNETFEDLSQYRNECLKRYVKVYPIAIKYIKQNLLQDHQLFVNITDNQGGEFGCYRYGTRADWALQALEWAYQDDYVDTEDNIEGDDIAICDLVKFNKEDVIDDINETWQLGIEPIEDIPQDVLMQPEIYKIFRKTYYEMIEKMGWDFGIEFLKQDCHNKEILTLIDIYYKGYDVCEGTDIDGGLCFKIREWAKLEIERILDKLSKLV